MITQKFQVHFEKILLTTGYNNYKKYSCYQKFEIITVMACLILWHVTRNKYNFFCFKGRYITNDMLLMLHRTSILLDVLDAWISLKWVSDYRLKPHEQCFSYTMAWDDDDVCFVLVRFWVLGQSKQQSTGRHVAPLRHNIWFRDTLSLLLLLYTVCLVETLQISIL